MGDTSNCIAVLDSTFVTDSDAVLGRPMIRLMNIHFGVQLPIKKGLLKFIKEIYSSDECSNGRHRHS